MVHRCLALSSMLAMFCLLRSAALQVTGAAPAVLGRRLAAARAQLRDRLYGGQKGTRCAE
ncbi:MAG: hypothetical protein QME94_01755 [Anaerolineae bacterium]|nr:hypothetical protein [Anaerolineae bacterium]